MPKRRSNSSKRFSLERMLTSFFDVILTTAGAEVSTNSLMFSGSAACAVGVAIARRGLGGRKNRIMMDGGLITIDWQDDGSIGGRVVMTGEVSYAYYGFMEGALGEVLEAADG